MKWFRLYSEIIDDQKMVDLTDREYRIMICMMAYACELEKEGVVPFCAEKIAWRIRFPVKAVQDAIEKMKSLQILQDNGVGIEFRNWKKRQFRSDNVADRVRKHRAKCNVQGNVSETLHETAPETETEADTEISSIKDTTCDQKPDPPCPHQAIIDLWHEMMRELPKVKMWGGQRESDLRARWRENPKRQNLEWWKGMFEYIRKRCPFLMGETNPRPGHKTFYLSLPWLVKRENFLKVLEGLYEER